MSRAIDVPSLLAALRIPIVRKAGEVYWACCPSPDHNERTPSWFMRERPSDRYHGSFLCFGCGFKGYPVQLVCTLLGVKQDAAFEWLRTMPKVEQPLPDGVEVVHVPMVRELQIPGGVEFGPFEEWPLTYREYLKSRSVVAQVEAWGLGYIPSTSDSKLAGRIWIPARDAGGRLLAYTARAVGPAKRRYREAYRAEGASGAAVFGELRWPALERKLVVVTEGAFNALAVERVAADLPVAALMGSSLDTRQVLKLARFATVAIASDPDKAGNKLREQLHGALKRYTRLVDIRIPEGQDCDSLPPAELKALVDSVRVV